MGYVDPERFSEAKTFRFKSRYAATMKMARMSNPSGYSGIATGMPTIVTTITKLKTMKFPKVNVKVVVIPGPGPPVPTVVTSVEVVQKSPVDELINVEVERVDTLLNPGTVVVEVEDSVPGTVSVLVGHPGPNIGAMELAITGDINANTHAAMNTYFTQLTPNTRPEFPATSAHITVAVSRQFTPKTLSRRLDRTRARVL